MNFSNFILIAILLKEKVRPILIWLYMSHRVVLILKDTHIGCLLSLLMGTLAPIYGSLVKSPENLYFVEPPPAELPFELLAKTWTCIVRGSSIPVPLIISKLSFHS